MRLAAYEPGPIEFLGCGKALGHEGGKVHKSNKKFVNIDRGEGFGGGKMGILASTLLSLLMPCI
jgi:hypothetical protein